MACEGIVAFIEKKQSNLTPPPLLCMYLLCCFQKTYLQATILRDATCRGTTKHGVSIAVSNPTKCRWHNVDFQCTSHTWFDGCSRTIVVGPTIFRFRWYCRKQFADSHDSRGRASWSKQFFSTKPSAGKVKHIKAGSGDGRL